MNDKSPSQDFEDFWCINVKNLKERNNDVLKQAQLSSNKSPVQNKKQAVQRTKPAYFK